MVQPNSRRPRRLSRITLCVVLIVLGCQSPLSVRTAAAAGSGPEVIQGLGNYFLTLPYGGIKMAVAVLGTVAGGMGVTFTGGEKVMYEKIWSPALGGKYVVTPAHLRGEKDLHFFGNTPVMQRLFSP